MAGLLDSLRSTLGVPGRRVYESEKKQPPFSGLNLKEKLQRIVMDKRIQGRDTRQRMQAVWYLTALYYRGYQNVELNVSGNGYDVYEREDFYVENQFRKHVDHVKQLQNKMEGDVVVRPASNSPIDLATARVADPVLTSQLDEIGYETVLDIKNLYKCLFGNAFIFTDYIQNKKYGSIVTPKYSYEERTGPDGEAMLSKVVSGYATEHKGKQICTVCSPLEINISTDIRPFTETPFIQWISRQDIDLINYIYPGLSLTGGDSVAEADMAAEYIETLGNLSGNVLGDNPQAGGDGQRQKVELVRTWLQPCEFRGDKELEREFSDGAHITTVNGKCVEYYPEALQDRWTHEVLIPVPHALLGDGLYDAIGPIDQINEMDSLVIQHMRYTTVGHKIYDSNVINIKDITNNPANGWIPGKPALDKSVRDAVADLSPNALSQDVVGWRAALMQSLQDMTSAYDPATGKGLGANTPYSQSVFLTERAQSRWQGSLSYNRPEMVRFRRQLLEDAKRRDSIRVSMTDNIGQWSFEQYTAADLQGSVDILLSNTDFKPKSRAEQVQGLQMLTTLLPIIQTMSPKQKLRVEELLGLPPDSNPMSTQIARARRMIDLLQKGEDIAPLALVDDPMAQVPVFQEYLASEEADSLTDTPEGMEIRAKIYLYMGTLLQMGVMQMSSPGGMMAMQIQGKGQPMQEGGGPPQPGQKKPAGGQEGQPGGGPGSAEQPPAQSPAPAPPISPPSA